MFYRSTSVGFRPTGRPVAASCRTDSEPEAGAPKLATSAPSSAAGFTRRTLNSNLDPTLTATLFDLNIGRDALVTARCTAAEGGSHATGNFCFTGAAPLSSAVPDDWWRSLASMTETLTVEELPVRQLKQIVDRTPGLRTVQRSCG